MKNEENEKQEDQQSDKDNNGKSEDTKSTTQTPLVTFYETVSLRIMTELMTARECERLKRITARDTRIIRDYLRVIFHNEGRKFIHEGKLKPLVKPKGKVNTTILDFITLTTSKKSSNNPRSSVPHDLKKRYPHCSHDEFQECRNKAIWTYESWRALQQTSSKKMNRPEVKMKTPRQLNRGKAGRGTVQVYFDSTNTTAKLWLHMRDSLDTKQKGKKAFPKLTLPLAYSSYHEQKLKPDDIKTIEFVYNTHHRQWWAHVAVSRTVPLYDSPHKPAVVGVDLGIKKTATAVVLNSTGRVKMEEILFIVNKERQSTLYHLEKRMRSIQSLLDTRIKGGQPHGQLNVKLAQLRSRHRSIMEQELGYAVNKLVEFVLSLKSRYNPLVVVGYPKYIRNSNCRGKVNKSLRRQLDKWCYRYFIIKLKHKLLMQGFTPYRVVAINERNTSNSCSRCLSMRTTRSHQGRFVCHHCSYELNADLNGARNIAKRLISYILHPTGVFKQNNFLRDYLTGDCHDLKEYGDLYPLGQWLKYSSGDTSFL